ncbi:MAG: tetratricopeptide repeat protein, partial [Deltaproteobacteria bacterium]|nr:tetratricopeptide repeat protein [Deltaproteobacteria bacterium]
SFEETHYNLALAYFKMGNFTDAIKEFKKTIDIGIYLREVNFAQPRLLIQSLNKLAESYFLAGICDEAIKTFIELLKVDVASAADSHYNIGLCYERLGNYALAMQEFQNVLRLKPEDEGALWNLKELQMKQRGRLRKP